MLSEIVREKAIASLPEALRIILLEESHVVCETVKENMAFLGSSGPFILPVARRELFRRLPTMPSTPRQCLTGKKCGAGMWKLYIGISDNMHKGHSEATLGTWLSGAAQNQLRKVASCLVNKVHSGKHTEECISCPATQPSQSLSQLSSRSSGFLKKLHPDSLTGCPRKQQSKRTSVSMAKGKVGEEWSRREAAICV